MSTNRFLELERQMLGDIYTSSEPLDNLTVLCDEFGSRFGGTEGERLAAEFMQQKLIEYGLQNVHLEPIEYIGWRRGETKLEIIEPIQKEIPCISLPHSPATEMEALLIDLGNGHPDKFDELAEEIAGKVVMANSEIRPGNIDRWVHRGEKYGRSVLAGAAGFIFINHYPGYGPATGGIGRGGEGWIPGISVSHEDGAFLQRLVKRHGEVKIRLVSSDQCEPMTSWNVIGDLPGSGPNGNMVMLGCHYDGHDISQGAADPASGAVAVMEAARVLAKYATPLSLTVRFALWGVEEIGLLGSRDYVRQHLDEMDKVRFYLNMDGAGANPDRDIILNEWPELAPLFRDWQQEMKLDFRIGQSVNAFSDHFPFLMEGVVTGSLGSVDTRLGRGYGHTRYDTLDKVPLKPLREASALAARVALRVANEADWPVARRDKDAVAGLFDGPAYKAEAAFRAQMEAFYQEKRGS